MSFENFNDIKGNKSEKPIDLGRRKFLGALGAGTAYLAVNSVPGVSHFVEESVSEEEISREVEKLKNALEELYSISIDFDSLDNQFESGSNLSLIEQRDTLRILERALAQYPKSFIKSTKLRNVHVVNNYLRKGLPFTAGLTHEHENPDSGRMLLNYNDLFSKLTLTELFPSHIPNTFHHELYHLNDDHAESGKNKNEFNTVWKKEHEENNGGAYVAGSLFREEGFPSAYARTSPSEHRAVIAEFLFSDYKGLMEMATTDVALQHSIEKVKQEFSDKTNGLMDKDYWRFVSSGNIEFVQRYITAKEKLLIRSNDVK